MLFPSAHRKTSPRVVITGAGIITALGVGWQTNAAGFRAGRVALKPVTLFDVSRQRVKIAGEISQMPALPATELKSAQMNRLDRATQLLLAAPRSLAAIRLAAFR